MLRIAQSEYDILTVARALVGDGSYASVEPLLVGKRDFPPQLGQTAIRLLKDVLARGVVTTLARRGGWRSGRHIEAGRVMNGRLWERHKAPELTFSAFSLELCRWLASGQAGAGRGDSLRVQAHTLGDEVLIYLAFDLLRESALAGPLADQVAVRSSGLAWLGFADVLCRRATPDAVAINAKRYVPFCTAPGSIVLEALQQDLTRRWLEMERSKKDIRALDMMSRLGAAQTVVLDEFMTAADQAGRRDLATFLLDAGAGLFPRTVLASAWIESLETTGSLSDRTSARRAAGAFLRALVRWRGWDSQHRGVRFIDDGYAAAQLLLSSYEPFGVRGIGHAEAVLRAMDSLEAAVVASAS